DTPHALQGGRACGHRPRVARNARARSAAPLAPAVRRAPDAATGRQRVLNGRRCSDDARSARPVARGAGDAIVGAACPLLLPLPATPALAAEQIMRLNGAGLSPLWIVPFAGILLS